MHDKTYLALSPHSVPTAARRYTWASIDSTLSTNIYSISIYSHIMYIIYVDKNKFVHINSGLLRWIGHNNLHDDSCGTTKYAF